MVWSGLIVRVALSHAYLQWEKSGKDGGGIVSWCDKCGGCESAFGRSEEVGGDLVCLEGEGVSKLGYGVGFEAIGAETDGVFWVWLRVVA